MDIHELEKMIPGEQASRFTALRSAVGQMQHHMFKGFRIAAPNLADVSTMSYRVQFKDKEVPVTLETHQDMMHSDEIRRTLLLSLTTELVKATDFYDPCPKCTAHLGNGPGGGVVCSNPECNYWFCY